MDGSDRRRARAVAIGRALVAAAMLALAACGGGSSSTPTVKPQPSPTPDPRAPTILKAYTDAETAELTAEEIPDANFPPLAQTLIDPALTRAREFLAQEQRDGIVGRGGLKFQRRPKVVDVNGDDAVVLDCYYDTSLLVYADTGQPVPDQPGGTQPAWAGVRALIHQVRPGIWRLAEEVMTVGSCPAGY